MFRTLLSSLSPLAFSSMALMVWPLRFGDSPARRRDGRPQPDRPARRGQRPHHPAWVRSSSGQGAESIAARLPIRCPWTGCTWCCSAAPAQETALRQFIADANTPGSPNYHKWLTPAEFGQRFGPSDQDIATVESWLSSQGFAVNGVLPGKQVIEFSGNVAQMRSAFAVHVHQYLVNGVTHFATATRAADSGGTRPRGRRALFR